MGRTELAKISRTTWGLCAMGCRARVGDRRVEREVTDSKCTRNVFLFHFAAPDPISKLCLMAED